mmetsp:Transcript_35895/g.70630  ORF Transcript_35895/g.70630 Transcript_35895/m.70630 type:complete len:151 (+) Transcript_35895:278-730(+)
MRGPNRNNSNIRDVPKVAAKYIPPPQAIPTAAESHTLAAVVRPCTICILSPVTSFFTVLFQISPAPKNPTPLGIAALIREASHVIGYSINAIAPQRVNRQEPSDTNAMVRIPAGRSAVRRSHPITPPRRTAMTCRRPYAHSVDVRKQRRA